MQKVPKSLYDESKSKDLEKSRLSSICFSSTVHHEKGSQQLAPFGQSKSQNSTQKSKKEEKGHGEGPDNPSEEKATKKNDKANKKDDCDFSEPKLLTSLKIIENIRSIGEESSKVKHVQVHSEIDALSRKQKVSRKVNIPFEEKIYKGLIELRVSDDELGLTKTSIPVKSKEFIKTREPEPLLSDYYQPKFDREYVVKPQKPKFEFYKVKKPEGPPSVYEETLHWEPDKL